MLFDDGSRRSPVLDDLRRAVFWIGSFCVAIDVRYAHHDVMVEISDLYRSYPTESKDAVVDFAISLKCRNAWRCLFRGEIQAYVNGRAPFQAMPRRLAVPMLESGINWFIGTSTTRFLLLHAAAVELNGKAVVLPGPSGAGKSTLCAALIGRGWRLLSDEFAMIRLDDGLIQPHPRPIGLKNEAIDIIESIMPDARFSKRYEGTAKGTLAYMHAPSDAVEKADIPARPALVIFPRRAAGGEASLQPLEKAPAFMGLVDQSANYLTMLEDGFEVLATFVEACDHYALSYDAVGDAVALIEKLKPVLQGSDHAA